MWHWHFYKILPQTKQIWATEEFLDQPQTFGEVAALGSQTLSTLKLAVSRWHETIAEISNKPWSFISLMANKGQIEGASVAKLAVLWNKVFKNLNQNIIS